MALYTRDQSNPDNTGKLSIVASYKNDGLLHSAQKTVWDIENQVEQDYVHAIRQPGKKDSKEIMPLHRALREDDWVKAKTLCQGYEQNCNIMPLPRLLMIYGGICICRKTWNILVNRRTKTTYRHRPNRSGVCESRTGQRVAGAYVIGY